MTPILCRNKEDEIGAGREMSGGVGRLGELGGGEEQPGVLFIGAGRRWSAVEAGRRAPWPLMVLGLVVAARFAAAVQVTGRFGQRCGKHPGRVERVGTGGRYVRV